MGFQIGDIVISAPGSGQATRSTYVTAGFITNPRGGRDVKLLRKAPSAHGGYSGLQTHESKLRSVERPVFKPGSKVLVEGFKGVFMSFERGGEVVRVMLAPRRRAFTGLGFIDIGPAVARVSYALFVIENCKV
ncbi:MULTISPECIES: hypothetical protein [unclassified Mesorhizobium]|uniref:hypothetical protein n=1 Tax=unclassified Mesorhizobium TaxID=325217 RepID=UPI000FD87BEA|nr:MULTISPECIES: hypothetical protein [unclassified Mesorhizobium]TGQ08705.1 hypothetical protein EN862_020870 [Mesorhizobium sp. M2E.F.Ca.ET.219.01.1.1]TGT69240.1 hypothetical protein EN809_023150 [Mesorhizobium sp. M2E.F.Ca.ET.166.01.1.1]TGW01572.1 hypothetical protein EN797_014645 [Mesorhizobium sp. M2E.F.Ca.ET.154.01.1.1]